MSIQKIVVRDFINKIEAVSLIDAETVLKVIKNQLDNEDSVEVDWNGLALISSSFVNKCIGDLYGCYDENLIKSKVKIINVADDVDQKMFVRVLTRAKQFYKDKEAQTKRLKEVFDDE